MGKIQRFFHVLQVLPNSIGKVGFWVTLQWTYGRAQKTLHIPVPRFLNVWPRFLEHPVKLRARSSDTGIFQECMIEEEYLPLKGLPLVTILDLGANVGLSSAWFLSRFQGSMTFAVEADADNYFCCCENLRPYGSRARTLHGAAWSERADLVVHRHVSCAAANSVGGDGGEAGELHVQGWDIPSLIEMSGFSHLDLLKIDIEGAEKAVFSADVSTWLSRVRNLCIELHGQKCRDTFFGALAKYDFEHTRSGSLDLCTNLRLKSQA
jgi:FkbM family methyltransferase